MEKKRYEKKTSNIYGNLFSGYDKKQFEESVELFFIRQKKWGVDLNWFKEKKCLDAGCGGGRFVVAMASLGASEVVGIDISSDAIKLAGERLKERSLDNGKAIYASVLNIPFGDRYFDYVISSGVIHHTPDPFKAFNELVRVTRLGGRIFLSVYGKGGLKWFLNDLFRFSLCKIIPFSVLENIFYFFGVPANKRYNLLDNLYVPYCYRYTESEIHKWFTDAGFENIRRVKFERYDYKTLKSRIIHGEGWIQIMADKKRV